MDFRRKHILHFIVFLISGLLIGSMLTLKYADHAGRSHVVYIAREELLNLEKERIRASGEKDLFFGMIGNELQKLIEETAMAYKSRRVKIIYSNYVRPGCALNLRRGARKNHSNSTIKK